MGEARKSESTLGEISRLVRTWRDSESRCAGGIVIIVRGETVQNFENVKWRTTRGSFSGKKREKEREKCFHHTGVFLYRGV